MGSLRQSPLCSRDIALVFLWVSDWGGIIAMQAIGDSLGQWEPGTLYPIALSFVRRCFQSILAFSQVSEPCFSVGGDDFVNDCPSILFLQMERSDDTVATGDESARGINVKVFNGVGDARVFQSVLISVIPDRRGLPVLLRRFREGSLPEYRSDCRPLLPGGILPGCRSGLR